ncbi:hypothetical protein DOTSEDRAFT_84481 [Dothistroma septosporum NZE10]|uniref:RING-type domain-containing protein n=1 Tax=Dothistroma septosporum (strain NZE10 / CBS 128990) TaxID=675120 RepID=N1Q146_DOTSN|nr:hypothetical protein DOTSEDRAFT_84481 [Dothistroma septosporum NZE10]
MDTTTPNGITMSATTFECSICCEIYADNTDLVSIKGDAVCRACFEAGIKPQFAAALKDESKYSGTSDACSRFIGMKSARPAGRKCDHCDEKTCACCGSLVGDVLSNHECQTAGDGEEAFAELERGQDYQKCPRCGGIVQLQDGCNHLVCSIPACREHFCYICGKSVMDEFGHWDIGKPCPKYNQPGSTHAMFETPGMFDLPPLDAFGLPPFDFAGTPAIINPLAPFMDPARREAIMILHDRSLNDLEPNALHEDDSPEIRLRKIDRRELERIVVEIDNIEIAAMANRGSPDFAPLPLDTVAAADLASILGSLAEVYTVHLETNQAVSQLIREAIETMQEDVEALVTQIRGEGFERFPTLRSIVDTYQLAVRGETEELRRQTRD